MKITEIIVRRETASDGSPIIGCRLRTDGSGENEFGCSAYWHEDGLTHVEIANTFRAFAAAIEKMDSEAKAA